MTENPNDSQTQPNLPECAVFVGVSLDGFLAKPNGDLSWMDEAAGNAGDHGYEAFIAGIDTLVWGRKTFEWVMAFDKWYHGKRRVVVLSHRPLDLSAARAKGAVVEQMSGTPQEVAATSISTGERPSKPSCARGSSVGSSSASFPSSSARAFPSSAAFPTTSSFAM